MQPLYGLDLFGEEVKPWNGALSDEFIVPPFSVLDSRQGFWRQRRAAWLSLGIQSGLGRGDNLLKLSAAARDAGGGLGTSVFDPVLCELAYRWFCPPKGIVLDPFAGGSVRGLVATLLGRTYVGVDLRKEQVATNKKQAAKFHPKPNWFCGDSRTFTKLTNGVKGDFIFSSPPYYGREQYSKLKKDLNNAPTYTGFLEGYQEAIRQAVSQLRQDRFACFEVQNIRDKQGNQVSFAADTVDAFEKAGASFYNHIIHVPPSASAQIKCKMFRSSRKVVPVHSDVLVFIKGNPKLAVAELEPFVEPRRFEDAAFAMKKSKQRECKALDHPVEPDGWCWCLKKRYTEAKTIASWKSKAAYGTEPKARKF